MSTVVAHGGAINGTNFLTESVLRVLWSNYIATIFSLKILKIPSRRRTRTWRISRMKDRSAAGPLCSFSSVAYRDEAYLCVSLFPERRQSYTKTRLCQVHNIKLTVTRKETRPRCANNEPIRSSGAIINARPFLSGSADVIYGRPPIAINFIPRAFVVLRAMPLSCAVRNHLWDSIDLQGRLDPRYVGSVEKELPSSPMMDYPFRKEDVVESFISKFTSGYLFPREEHTPRSLPYVQRAAFEHHPVEYRSFFFPSSFLQKRRIIAISVIGNPRPGKVAAHSVPRISSVNSAHDLPFARSRFTSADGTESTFPVLIFIVRSLIRIWTRQGTAPDPLGHALSLGSKVLCWWT